MVASMAPSARPKRITTPGTPPSRTSRLEPTPITVTGTSAGLASRKASKSSRSAGRNRPRPGRRRRNQVTVQAERLHGLVGGRGPVAVGRSKASGASGCIDFLGGHHGRSRLVLPSPPRAFGDGAFLARQGVGPGGDVAGAEADHQVARRRPCRRSCRRARAGSARAVTWRCRAGPQAGGQGVPVGPFDRRSRRRHRRRPRRPGRRR